jgi:hypothetical protein
MKKVLFAFGILAFGISISLGDPIKRIINEYSNATYRVRNDDIIGDYIRQNIDYANRGFRPASYTYKT